MAKLAGIKQVVCGGLVILAVARTASATPITGVDTTNLAVGTFDGGLAATAQTNAFGVELRATGPTDVYMLENRIAPSGTYGWHSHPGPSIVVVQSGGDLDHSEGRRETD
jgi:hypothetical protein